MSSNVVANWGVVAGLAAGQMQRQGPQLAVDGQVDLGRQAPARAADGDGEALERVRIDNDPVALGCAMEKAGANPEVVVEATYGWY